jgi:hypothetical protein
VIHICGRKQYCHFTSADKMMVKDGERWRVGPTSITWESDCGGRPVHRIFTKLWKERIGVESSITKKQKFCKESQRPASLAPSHE